VIGGSIAGGVEGQHFGLVAEWVLSLEVGGVAVDLNDGPHNDDLPLTDAGDVTVLEVADGPRGHRWDAMAAVLSFMDLPPQPGSGSGRHALTFAETPAGFFSGYREWNLALAWNVWEPS
jgi:hypothetical protein